jgi:hypothetical protein
VELYHDFPLRLHVVHSDDFIFVLFYVYTLIGCGAEKGENNGRRTRENGELEKERT